MATNKDEQRESNRREIAQHIITPERVDYFDQVRRIVNRVKQQMVDEQIDRYLQDLMYFDKKMPRVLFSRRSLNQYIDNPNGAGYGITVNTEAHFDLDSVLEFCKKAPTPIEVRTSPHLVRTIHRRRPSWMFFSWLPVCKWRAALALYFRRRWLRDPVNTSTDPSPFVYIISGKYLIMHEHVFRQLYNKIEPLWPQQSK